MNDNVKIAILVVVGALLGEGLWIYFSPYHTCVRVAYTGANATLNCARVITPGNANNPS